MGNNLTQQEIDELLKEFEEFTKNMEKANSEEEDDEEDDGFDLWKTYHLGGWDGGDDEEDEEKEEECTCSGYVLLHSGCSCKKGKK